MVALIPNPANSSTPIQRSNIEKTGTYTSPVYGGLRLEKRQLDGEDGLWGKRQQSIEVEEKTKSKQNPVDRLQARAYYRNLLRLRIDIDNMLSEYKKQRNKHENRRQKVDHGLWG